MNPLERWFQNTHGREVHKWVHYFDIYHRHFQKFRGKKITLVEFGVWLGGSAQMWREYFGPRAQLYGVDIDPACAQWSTPWFDVFVGDQSDRSFLRKIRKEIGPIDIVIEDGGHYPDQQIATFEEFYPRVRPGGVFLIEDLHTSYWPHYSGGLQRPGTFIEYAKPLIDKLNAWHSVEKGFEPDTFTRTTRSMHVYDSIIVFEKGMVTAPHNQRRGTADWDHPDMHQLSLSPRARLHTAAVEVSEKVRPKLGRIRRGIRSLQERRGSDSSGRSSRRTDVEGVRGLTGARSPD